MRKSNARLEALTLGFHSGQELDVMYCPDEHFQKRTCVRSCVPLGVQGQGRGGKSGV